MREDVYCALMYFVERGEREFTQKGLAELLNMSLGSVNYALRPLFKMGAVLKKRRGFVLVNPKKLLYVWAVYSRQKVLYATHYSGNVEDIETMMPSGLFTAYSGAKFYYGINPADYGEVYIYADSKEVMMRFPERKGPKNVFVLKKLRCFDILAVKKAPLSLIFADLFNLPTWYAADFLRAVEVRIDELLE